MRTDASEAECNLCGARLQGLDRCPHAELFDCDQVFLSVDVPEFALARAALAAADAAAPSDLDGLHEEIREAVVMAASILRTEDDVGKAHQILAAGAQRASRSVAPADTLRSASAEFLAAVEALCDWMNGCDLSADHAGQKPDDYKLLCLTMQRLQAALSASPAPPAPSTPADGWQSTVLLDVAAERARQVDKEGWSTEHDDSHRDGALAAAGASYALHASKHRAEYIRELPPAFWPWDKKWWNPKEERHDLVRAAALIVAEIERIDRLRNWEISPLPAPAPDENTKGAIFRDAAAALTAAHKLAEEVEYYNKMNEWYLTSEVLAALAEWRKVGG